MYGELTRGENEGEAINDDLLTFARFIWRWPIPIPWRVSVARELPKFEVRDG